MTKRDELADRPFISIIVPIYNEERYIERCAKALIDQAYPRDRFEILFVDNNSSDRSVEIARGIEGIRVFCESTQGDYAARNRGIAEARGEIFAFVDSDTAPFPDWLEKIAATMAEDPQIGVIVGGLRFNGSSQALRMLADYEEDKAKYTFASDDPTMYFGYTCNLAARRKIFDQLGPFASIQRNADVVFVRSVVDTYSTDAVVYRHDVAVLRLEIQSLIDYFHKQVIYGKDFRRYKESAGARPLRTSERFSIFRHVVRNRRYSPVDTLFLLAILVVGALCYDVARLLSTVEPWSDRD
ncbi:MAG: glycosyltransferase family 2 protein [Deltaproteobacteria bacterium]|jgi:glycosyltransferase involved in cell wall biosynthesis|nr:glycosyltransferase family 2 protein [Deltaproteobacteria bacterium]MBW2541929.1 glycosyltransferase family 2 protein [Deltaproteobacteria bacterium]